MEFRLLGPVSLVGASGPLPIGPAKRRSLLAALLLRAGTPVPVDALTEALWSDEPPVHARTVIHGHVSRLRSLLSVSGLDACGVELLTQGGAYTLQLPETLLDARRFDELVDLAGRQRGPADTAVMLSEALSLWRGPALTGTAPTAPLVAAAQALEESRLTAVERLAGVYGQLGEEGRAVALLQAELVERPLREPLGAGLIRALHRSGRQAEALEFYHRTRRLLADEMGVDPGPVLRAAYAEALRESAADAPHEDGPRVHQGPSRAPAPPHPTRSAQEEPPRTPPQPDRAVPRLLPRAPRGFVGRRAELDSLTRALREQHADSPIAVLTGPAGVGKSAMALHWAHEHAGAHPGGQLFADLRGFSGEEPVEPDRVLREFLVALGVRPHEIPAGREGAGALYRALLSEREVLVVLDNARDSAQVRPLLPGAALCTTVVTSRHRLEGLVASDCAVPLPLAVLGPQDGSDLFSRALGPGRPGAGAVDQEAVHSVTRLCAGLPLALRIAAARLTGRPQWSVGDLAAELADGRSRLDLLSAEDTGVAAALRVSVALLSEADTWLLASLGRGFTRESDVHAAAALAGVTAAAARAGLERLASAHLVEEESPGRYVLHDLVRLYARGLDGPADAARRLVDHWLRAQHAAVLTVDDTGCRVCALPEDCAPPPGASPWEGPAPLFTDRESARRWFAAERDGLLAALDAASALEDDDRTWRLAALLWPLVLWRPHPGWRGPLLRAAAAAERTGDDEGVGRLRSTLGVLLVETGQHEEAVAHLEGSLEPLLRASLPGIAAQVLVLLSICRNHLHDQAGALHAQEAAARLASEGGHPTAAMLSHHHAAHLAVSRGEAEAAAGHLARALAAVPREETEGWRPLLWESYGVALHRAGFHSRAREALLVAVEVTEEEDLPARTADALAHLGDVTTVLEGPEHGEAYRRRALELRRGISPGFGSADQA